MAPKHTALYWGMQPSAQNLATKRGQQSDVARFSKAMEETERKIAFDFRQPLDATYWRRVSAVSIFLAPVIAAAYAVSIHEQCNNPCSVSIHAVSRAARLVLTEVFVIGLFAAVSPHEPTGSAKMVSLACMVTGVLLSLLAAFDRWSQPSASEGEHAIRVGIPSAIFFLWLWLLYRYYWRQSCAAWEGFRLCAAAANCMRLVGVLLLRFAMAPAVASYPPGQLPFESAFACNLLLMLVLAALTPPNRMRLALASGLQTVSLSQLQPGHGALAQPPQLGAERHPGMVAASAQVKVDEWRRSFFDVASQSAQTSAQSHDSLGAELPGLQHLPLGFGIAAPTAGARSHVSQNSQEMPLLSFTNDPSRILLHERQFRPPTPPPTFKQVCERPWAAASAAFPPTGTCRRPCCYHHCPCPALALHRTPAAAPGP